MKLWRVAVEHDLFVLAVDEDSAKGVARLHLQDNEPDSISARPVTANEQVPEQWSDGLPYGCPIDDERTVGELVASMDVKRRRTANEIIDLAIEAMPRSEYSPGPPSTADARLIAAAPELLTALRALEGEFTYLVGRPEEHAELMAARALIARIASQVGE